MPIINLIIRIIYYPITFIVYMQKSHYLKKLKKQSLVKTIKLAQKKIELFYVDNLALINCSSQIKSIYKIHQKLMNDLKTSDEQMYNSYHYDKDITLLTLNNIGLNKFTKSFQLKESDRTLYVTGKIVSTYKNSDSTLDITLEDAFGKIIVKVEESNIQYLLDYFDELNIYLNMEKRRSSICKNTMSDLISKIDKDITNLVITVPILVYSKDRAATDFYNREVGKNEYFYSVPNEPIALITDINDKYNNYSLFSLTN